MRKKLMALFTVLLTLLFGLAIFAACGNEETGKGEAALAVPAGLAVDAQGVVTWTAVEGAQTYTLKVNETEFANAVSPFDLHEKAADALESNGAQNSIAVKADAVGEREGSAYSDAVTYTFKTADETAAAEYVALVEKIDVDAPVQADVIAAKEAYAALTEQQREIAGNAAYDAMNAADGKVFVFLVSAIGPVENIAIESATAVNAAEIWYNSLLDKEQEAIAEAKTALTSARNKLNEVSEMLRTEFGALVDEVDIAEDSDAAFIDAAATAIAQAQATYEEYSEAEKAAVSDLYNQLVGKQATLDAASDKEFAKYQALVAAAQAATVDDNDATVAALENAVDAANTAETALSEYTKEANATEYAAEQSKLDDAEETLAEWKSDVANTLQEMSDAIDALAEVTETMDAAEAQSALSSAKDILDDYNGYAAYIRADSQIGAQKDELDAYIADVEKRIDTISEAAKRELQGLIDAITVTAESRGQAIDDAYSAIEEVKETFKGYHASVQDVVAETYGQLADKESVLSAAASAEYVAYQTLVEAVSAEVTEAASADDLSGAITAAESAFGALAEYTKTQNDVTAIDATVTNAKATLETWNREIESTEAAMKVALEGSSDIGAMESAEVEAMLDGLLSALEGYEDYAAYIKSDDGVTVLFGDMQEAEKAAEDRIAAIAEDYASRVMEAIEDAMPDENSYNALVDLQEEYAAYGSRTQQAAATAKGSVDSAIEKLLATPVSSATLDDERIVIGEGNDQGSFQIVRKYFNFRNEAIEIDGTLLNVTVTAKVDGEPADVSLTERELTYNFRIPFDSSAQRTISYTISVNDQAPETITLKVNAPIENTSVIYYTQTDGKVDGIDANNVLQFAGVQEVYGQVYVDVYLASSFVLTESPNDQLWIYGTPIAEKIAVSAGSTSLSDICREIARQGYFGEDISVRLLVYQMTGDAETGYTVSRIRQASVSEEVNITVTESDKYIRIDSVNSPIAAWPLASDADENTHMGFPYELALIDANPLYPYFSKVNVYAYDVTDIVGELTLESILAAGEPYAVTSFTTRAPVPWSQMNEAIRLAALEKGAQGADYNYTRTFAFAVQIMVNDDGIESLYIDSVIAFGIVSGSDTIGTVQRDLEEYLRPSSAAQVQIAPSGAFEFLRAGTPGSIISNGGVDHVELCFTKNDVSFTLYIYAVAGEDGSFDGTETVYITLSKAEIGTETTDTIENQYSSVTVQLIGGLNNCWCNAVNMENYINAHYSELGLSADDFALAGWSMATRAVISADGGYALDGIMSEAVVYPSL